MDWTQIILPLITILGMFIANAALIIPLFFWIRTESRADHRALESWTKEMLTAIQQEIKDFHGRLCAIEERNRK